MHKIRGNNLGRGISLFLRWTIYESTMHEDISAWGAPSECHDLVARGEAQRFRAVRRHIEGVTGLKWRVFCQECGRRTNGFRWMYHRYGMTL